MERRDWKRAVVAFLGKIRPVEESAYYDVMIADIHHQGCCLQSPVESRQGQDIRIVVDLPIEGPLYLAGTVRWCRRDPSGNSFAIGILFVVNSPEAVANQQKLYSYCTQK